MSAERRGAMPTPARCVKLLCGHAVRLGRFTSTMTRLLGKHARKQNGSCHNRSPIRDGESQALVAHALPEKQMAGACSCKSRPAEVFGGCDTGQTAVLNLLKNRWQGHVAVRVAALEACGRVGSVWGVGGRANGSLEPLKNRWQGHAPEKQMAGACSCKSCCLGGLRKRLGGLRAGKRQS